MIGLFKKKEQNNKINLSNYFNWIKSLDKQKLELSNQDLDERLSQSKLVYKFLKSEKGKKASALIFRGNKLVRLCKIIYPHELEDALN